MIKIDGESHVTPDPAEYDVEQSRWPEERGYRVIRFSAQQVEDDLVGAVEGIREACKEPPDGDN